MFNDPTLSRLEKELSNLRREEINLSQDSKEALAAHQTELRDLEAKFGRLTQDLDRKKEKLTYEINKIEREIERQREKVQREFDDKNKK